MYSPICFDYFIVIGRSLTRMCSFICCIILVNIMSCCSLSNSDSDSPSVSPLIGDITLDAEERPSSLDLDAADLAQLRAIAANIAPPCQRQSCPTIDEANVDVEAGDSIDQMPFQNYIVGILDRGAQRPRPVLAFIPPPHEPIGGQGAAAARNINAHDPWAINHREVTSNPVEQQTLNQIFNYQRMFYLPRSLRLNLTV